MQRTGLAGRIGSSALMVPNLPRTWDFKVGVARKPRRFRNLPGRLFSPYTEVCILLICLL